MIPNGLLVTWFVSISVLKMQPWWTLPPQWLNGVPACCILIAENILFSSWFTQTVQPAINHSWGMSDNGNGNVGRFPVRHIFTGVHLLDTGQSWSELEVCRTWIWNVLLIVVARAPGEACDKHTASSSIDKHTGTQTWCCTHRHIHTVSHTQTHWIEDARIALITKLKFPVHFTQIRPLCSNQNKNIKIPRYKTVHTHGPLSFRFLSICVYHNDQLHTSHTHNDHT